MKLSEAQSKAVFKIKIEIGDKLGAAPDDVYVVLREPTYAELMVAAQAGGDVGKSADATSKMLPALIIEHNLEIKDGEKASPEQVADVIRSSSSLFTFVVQQWQEALPLAKKSPPS